VAGVVALIAVGAVFAVLLPYVFHDGTGPPDADPAEVRTRLERGQGLLSEGKFQLARAELEAARQLAARQAQALTPEEHRHLAQLHRQAALLTDNLDLSLQQILEQAATTDAQEWQAQFTRRYRGRAVVFDGVLRRDLGGQVRMLDYFLFVKNEPVRLEWQELRLLAPLPLQEPQRLLFGARLASARREDRGMWVVRFEPDSGVLITDPGAAAAVCLQPVDEPLREVLQRQQAWLADLPLAADAQ
jgi:hypothetical protein